MKHHTGEGLGGGIALVLAIFVGLIVWFVKVNGALNAYWRSLGVH
jgi:hypothetical protein